MMARFRDAYHDYISIYEGRQLLRGKHALDVAIAERKAALITRSGAGNVKSGRINEWYDPSREERVFSISFNSRAWTGLQREPYQWRPMRASRAFHHRLAVYLGIGIKKLAHTVFQHGWNWCRDECDVCGLTREESVDYSWRGFPRSVAVRA